MSLPTFTVHVDQVCTILVYCTVLSLGFFFKSRNNKNSGHLINVSSCPNMSSRLAQIYLDFSSNSSVLGKNGIKKKSSLQNGTGERHHFEKRPDCLCRPLTAALSNDPQTGDGSVCLVSSASVRCRTCAKYRSRQPSRVFYTAKEELLRTYMSLGGSQNGG